MPIRHSQRTWICAAADQPIGLLESLTWTLKLKLFPFPALVYAA